MALITTCSTLRESLEDVVHVQECVYDDLQLKQDVFRELDQLQVLSRVKEHKSQCLVAHPINTLNLVRLVELVPCLETRLDILTLTMDEIGRRPVVLRKEVFGFAINRPKYALFQEAFRLVYDGVDTVVSDGLGPRYAFMGPWMTAHLNAAGMDEYLERYSEGIYNVSRDCQPLLRIEGEAAQLIVDAMTHDVPVESLDTKRAWRDKCPGELAKTKAKLGGGL